MMEAERVIAGQSEEEIWQQVAADLNSGEDVLEYRAVLDQNGTKVLLDIDIDLGGGFESGYELTTFSAAVGHIKDFRFAIHHESFIDEIGKFFGMEDIEIGYPEFDKRLVVKTNNALRTKAILADESTRRLFQSVDGFTFGIAHHHIEGSDEKAAFLELKIEQGITDVVQLRALYHAFYTVLVMIEETEEET